jgi:hypothetical protein
MNAIDGNGPVVEPMIFELGIAGDMELENWARRYTKKLMRDLTSHGAKYKYSPGMKIEAGGILILFCILRIRRR